MQKPILCVTPLQGCALVLAAAAVLLASHAAPAGALVVAADGLSPIGICWGRVSHAPMPPMPVVSMLQVHQHEGDKHGEEKGSMVTLLQKRHHACKFCLPGCFLEWKATAT